MFVPHETHGVSNRHIYSRLVKLNITQCRSAHVYLLGYFAYSSNEPISEHVNGDGVRSYVIISSVT